MPLERPSNLILDGFDSLIEFIQYIHLDIIGTSWENYPRHTQNNQIRPFEYSEFYDYMKKKDYPNISFIGKTYSDMRFDRNASHWFDRIHTLMYTILGEIHTDKPINNWLSVVDTLLQEPEYAQTFAYVNTLVNNKNYRDILNDQDSTTQSELNTTLTLHYNRLVKLHTALKTVNDQQTKNRKQDVVDDIVKLGNSWI